MKRSHLAFVRTIHHSRPTPCRSSDLPVDPLAQYAGHQFIGVAVGRNVLGNETLNSIACSGAAVEERRHIRRNHMPGEMTYI